MKRIRLINKRAQIRMTETITVLFIFFVLVAFGFIFYTQFQRASLERAEAEIAGQRAVSLSLRAQFLSELQCTTDGAVKPDCVDVLRMDAFSDIVQTQDTYYQEVLGSSHIFVQELYPNNRTWELYGNASVFVGSNRKLVTPTPVAILDPLLPKGQQVSFGVLQVEVFS